MCLFHKIAPSQKAHKRGVSDISETKGGELDRVTVYLGYARERRWLARNDSGTVSSGRSVCTSGDPFASPATGRAKCA